MLVADEQATQNMLATKYWVVTTDAWTVLIVVLLGVAHFIEFRLRREREKEVRKEAGGMGGGGGGIEGEGRREKGE